MLIFYDIIYILFALCYLPLFLIRGKCHRGFLMRMGIFPQGAINKLKEQKAIWLHTVSVGEAQAASSLVKNLKREYPDFRLVISTVTKTGNKIAQRLLDIPELAIYSPLDIGFVTRRAINFVNPRLFIIAETEIWPNLIINLAKKDIPVVLVNGRISRGSFRGYKIIRLFLKKIFQSFSLFCMQTKEDAQRIIELGADEKKVKVTGNMKFDIRYPVSSIQYPDLGLSKDEQLFIAGSTHYGEEKIILQVYKELIESHPSLRLLIAPRHIERVQKIERLVSEFGFKSQRISQLDLNERRTRSDLAYAKASRHRQRPILILNTIGQLKSLYAFADIVFIGGSLIPHGGQNPIEPAVFSKPIIFGPYMSNFSNIVEVFLNKKAAIMVKDIRQLKNTCIRLLNEPVLRKELGNRAKELVQENKGASLKNMELIRGLIINREGINES